MPMQMFSLGQLVAGAAYLLLTHALFTMGNRSNSLNARLAGLGFAYCALATMAQIVLSLSPGLSGAPGMESFTPSGIGFWILYGIRPYVLLATAYFCLRHAQTVPLPLPLQTEQR